MFLIRFGVPYKNKIFFGAKNDQTIQFTFINLRTVTTKLVHDQCQRLSPTKINEIKENISSKNQTQKKHTDPRQVQVSKQKHKRSKLLEGRE